MSRKPAARRFVHGCERCGHHHVFAPGAPTWNHRCKRCTCPAPIRYVTPKAFDGRQPIDRSALRQTLGEWLGPARATATLSLMAEAWGFDPELIDGPADPDPDSAAEPAEVRP